MRNWSIKTKVVILALTPAVIIAVVLASYFTRLRMVDMEDSLHERGLALARQLAPASEYGMFSGNKAMLQKLTDSAVREADVNSVVITGTCRSVVASSRVSQTSQTVRGNRREALTLRLSVPIRETQLNLNDLTPGSAYAGTTPGSEDARVLGEVTVEMSRQMTQARELRELWISAGIGLLCLVVSAIVAVRIGHRVTRPIANLARAMEGLGKGDLEVRVTPSSMGELQTLEHGINEMAPGSRRRNRRCSAGSRRRRRS